MTYATIDQSTQDGDVVALFTFVRGSKTWRYTAESADYIDTSVSPNVTHLTVQGGIDITDVESTDERQRNQVVLTVHREFPIAELFRVFAPTDRVFCTYREVHRGDTDYLTAFKLLVRDVSWSGARAEIRLISLEEAGAEYGLRMKASRNCEAMHFGDGCNLLEADFDHATTVSTIAGNIITVASVAAGLPYRGGKLKFTDADGNTDLRMIIEHSGTTLTLVRQMPTLSVSANVVLIPACDRTMTTCHTIYANKLNNRGRPHMSTKNIMGGEAIL